MFPGWRGKWRIAVAFVRGDLEALLLIPKMLRKRAQVNRIRRLSAADTRRLILAHRITLEELTTQAAIV